MTLEVCSSRHSLIVIFKVAESGGESVWNIFAKNAAARDTEIFVACTGSVSPNQPVEFLAIHLMMEWCPKKGRSLKLW